MAEFVEVLKERKRMCGNVICDKCELNLMNNLHRESCKIFCIKYPEEAEKIIMEWASEHPIRTNAEKFNEVFGFELDGCSEYTCMGIDCPHNADCDTCKYNGFWSKEYVEPKGEE